MEEPRTCGPIGLPLRATTEFMGRMFRFGEKNIYIQGKYIFIRNIEFKAQETHKHIEPANRQSSYWAPAGPASVPSCSWMCTR